MIPTTWHSRKGKTMKMLKKISGCRDGVGGGMKKPNTESL